MVLTWLCLTAVLFVAILGGYVALSVNKANQRALAALSALKCPSCGAVFGMPRTQEIQAEVQARNRELLADAQRRGVRLRLDPRWTFACVPCGARLTFHPDTHALERAVAAA